MRNNAIDDPLLLSRKLGHPELIFNETVYCNQEFNTANSDGSWSFFNSR